MNPISLMRRFTEDIDRAFSGLGSNQGRRTEEQDFDWIPTVEVRQSGNNLIIHAELPGLSEDDDVTVEATDDGLVIAGERKREYEAEEGGVYRSERVYGRFYRLIPLPENAQIDQAQASFNNGVLEISIPVPEAEKQRREIPIGSAQQGQQQSGQQQSKTGQQESQQGQQQSQEGQPDSQQTSAGQTKAAATGR